MLGPAPADCGEQMAGVEVAAQQLWQFGTYLNGEVWNDFHRTVRDQAGLQGCNTEGFIGLISPLAGAVGELHGWSDHMRDVAIDRLHGVSRGLISTAYSYAGMDQRGRDNMEDVPDNKRRPSPSGPGIAFGGGHHYHNPTPVTASRSSRVTRPSPNG
jgi:hypothetical protein